MLLTDQQQRIHLAELGKGVALPLAGPVAAVAAFDEYADELRIVDGRLVALLINVVELRVDVHDLRHDVSPLRGADVAVHIEGQVGEGPKPGRIKVASAQVRNELLLPHPHRGVGGPDRLQLLDGLVVQPGTADRAQERGRHAVHR